MLYIGIITHYNILNKIQRSQRANCANYNQSIYVQCWYNESLDTSLLTNNKFMIFSIPVDIIMLKRSTEIV